MSDDHEERIERVLARRHVGARAAGRDGAPWEGVDTRTPLSELVARESVGRETDDESVVRVETLQRLLGFLFEEGPHPGRTMRRLYAVAWALRRDLLMSMTQTELAQMFAETRAAQSWRIKRIFSGTVERSGCRGRRVPGQRGEDACAAYAARARGNHNRKGKDRDGKEG